MPRKKKPSKKIATASTKALADNAQRQRFVEAVDQVERWILEGQRDLTILASAREGFPEFAAETLYDAASLKLAGNARLTDEVIFGLCIAGTFEIYRRYLESHNLDGALSALKQIAQLQRTKPTPPAPDEGQHPPC